MIQSKGISSKPPLPLIAAITLLAFAAGTVYCQSGKSRTDPENANEARLNRLQPPAQELQPFCDPQGILFPHIAVVVLHRLERAPGGAAEQEERGDQVGAAHRVMEPVALHLPKPRNKVR